MTRAEALKPPEDGAPVGTATPGASAPASGGATATALALTDVGFTYPNGGVEAVRAVSFDADRGMCVGIVGPSGCGKSTLLSLMAGLRRPSTGAFVLNSFNPTQHRVTMMFQQDTLLPWATVAQNVKLFYRKPRGRNAREVDDLVDQLLALAQITEYRGLFPYQLSGGMKRRVAFLSAIAALPEVLLLDEPFSSLDEPTRVAIHQDVFRIIRQLGTTTVLVTHDLAEAISLCDKVIILTSRPGTVFTSHLIPFGDVRNMLELRRTPTFLQLYGALWENLSRQIVGRPATADLPRLSTVGHIP